MGKRGNGEGSITRRKDGLYMARYTVETATGAKRKAVYAKTLVKRRPRSCQRQWQMPRRGRGAEGDRTPDLRAASAGSICS
jgi:hypothetical protein